MRTHIQAKPRLLVLDTCVHIQMYYRCVCIHTDLFTTYTYGDTHTGEAEAAGARYLCAHTDVLYVYIRIYSPGVYVYIPIHTYTYGDTHTGEGEAAGARHPSEHHSLQSRVPGRVSLLTAGACSFLTA